VPFAPAPYLNPSHRLDPRGEPVARLLWVCHGARAAQGRFASPRYARRCSAGSACFAAL